MTDFLLGFSIGLMSGILLFGAVAWSIMDKLGIQIKLIHLKEDKTNGNN